MALAASPLDAWDSFYVIVGSSAGALTGLQFVVVALTPESRNAPRSSDGLMAFGTPTIVHFCAVLLLAAVLSAPWPTLTAAATAVAACAVGALAYCGVVVRRAVRQRDYQPVFEDWLWHTIFPVLGYAVELAAAVLFTTHPTTALFLLAGTALLLIFTGIHNAWDAAVFIAIGDGVAARDGGPDDAARR